MWWHSIPMVINTHITCVVHSNVIFVGWSCNKPCRIENHGSGLSPALFCANINFLKFKYKNLTTHTKNHM